MNDKPIYDDMPGHVSNDVIKANYIAKLQQRISTLEKALEEIALGEGAFSLDPLTHAGNCIENMKAIATRALSESESEK